jgi:hypothetical protein
MLHGVWDLNIKLCAFVTNGLIKGEIEKPSGLYPITFFIFLSYYVFDEYSLVLVLNMMSKKLKSVTKKHFGQKCRAEMADTLFQGCSTANSWRAEMMKLCAFVVNGPIKGEIEKSSGQFLGLIVMSH